MEKAYNSVEAAGLLGIKYRTMRKYLQEGIVKGRKIEGTRRWIIMESEIKRLRGEESVQGVQ